MNSTRVLILLICVVTVTLVVLGVLFPSSNAAAAPMGPAERSHLLREPSSARAAAEILAGQIGRRDWAAAYDSLANKNEFTEQEFVRDLTGTYPNLRTYATLDRVDLHQVRSSGDQATIRAAMRWSTVVGTFQDVRDLQVVRAGRGWQVAWPLVREPKVPPQVIPVNYLRWDVIYRGPQDDWGAQDVEAPHVRIVDMHPIDRAGSVVLLGELLNQDVVPAFVTVKASLLDKNGSAFATEDSFDHISHILLPKQVTPFRIDFPGIRLSQVDSVRMDPSSGLVAASADPIIEIQDQKLTGLPDPSLTGELLNQSGQVVNIAHVLGTFYDPAGQLVWVSDAYSQRALMPGTPLSFSVPVPADLLSQVHSFRVVTSSYSSTRMQ